LTPLRKGTPWLIKGWVRNCKPIAYRASQRPRHREIPLSLGFSALLQERNRPLAPQPSVSPTKLLTRSATIQPSIQECASSASEPPETETGSSWYCWTEEYYNTYIVTSPHLQTMSALLEVEDLKKVLELLKHAASFSRFPPKLCSPFSNQSDCVPPTNCTRFERYICCMAVLMNVMVLARLWSRKRIKGMVFGWDDWLAIPGLALALGWGSSMWKSILRIQTSEVLCYASRVRKGARSERAIMRTAQSEN
jgi:hypothetical protein